MLLNLHSLMASIPSMLCKDLLNGLGCLKKPLPVLIEPVWPLVKPE